MIPNIQQVVRVFVNSQISNPIFRSLRGTIQETNISQLGKRHIIFKHIIGGSRIFLFFWRCTSFRSVILKEKTYRWLDGYIGLVILRDSHALKQTVAELLKWISRWTSSPSAHVDSTLLFIMLAWLAKTIRVSPACYGDAPDKRRPMEEGGIVELCRESLKHGAVTPPEMVQHFEEWYVKSIWYRYMYCFILFTYSLFM